MLHVCLCFRHLCSHWPLLAIFVILVFLKDFLHFNNSCRFLSQLLTNSRFIEGFLIRYRNLETGHYDVLSIHNSGSEYIVASLDKFTRYQFFLVPFFQSVLGRPSNIEEVRTREDGKSPVTHSVAIMPFSDLIRHKLACCHCVPCITVQFLKILFSLC